MKIQSDGNGGFNVSKSITYLTGIMLILSIFGMVVSVTAFGVYNRDKISTMETQVAHNTGVINSNSLALARIEPRLNNIEGDIKEIKVDIKQLIKEQK